MKKGDSIVNSVFSAIDNVVSTVETIHGDIAEKTAGRNEHRMQNPEKRKNIYDLIKSINGNIGTLLSDFFKK